MAVDKLVDSTKLDNALTYEAGKIRAKLESQSQLTFDFSNEKGFGDYIEQISGGGGGGDGFLIGGQTVRIKNTSSSQQVCIRIRNVNYGTTHLGAYSTNIAAGATITSYNYFATFEKNGTKYIVFHTGHNPVSVTYNGEPVAFVSTGSAAQWDVEIALPSGFDNTYTIDINW